MIALLVFWLSVLALFHSYVMYPLLLNRLLHKKKNSFLFTEDQTYKPFISVIIAAYNEEQVLGEKLISVLQSSYPKEKMEVLVGSDASSDNTNTVLQQLSDLDSRIKPFFFDTRRGKGPILNELVPKTRGEILILTDANVMFHTDTLSQLIHSFADSKVGLVDSNMKHKGVQPNGISFQENAYITREVRIKYAEGLLWGAMMGPFGGCYAIRKSLFTPIPDKNLVDDFFLNMSVLKQGYKALSNIDSIVYEDVSNSLKTELRRKTRIATGNFQNLAYFGNLLLPPWTGIAFAFLSHKILRWIGPFFLISALIASLYLYNAGIFYKIAFWTQVSGLILPLADFLLRKINIHIIILRFLSHFYSMNLAMLAGFIRYLKGVNSNVWQPTQRNQSQ